MVRVAELHRLHPRHTLICGIAGICAELKEGATHTSQRKQADDDPYLRITVGAEVENLRH